MHDIVGIFIVLACGIIMSFIVLMLEYFIILCQNVKVLEIHFKKRNNFHDSKRIVS